MDNTWKKITENVDEYNLVSFSSVGDVFQGVLKSKKVEQTQYDTEQLTAYFFIEDDEKIYKLFCSVVLGNAIEKIEIGSEVRIVYKGMRQGKQYFYADYNIFTRPGPVFEKANNEPF